MKWLNGADGRGHRAGTLLLATALFIAGYGNRSLFRAAAALVDPLAGGWLLLPTLAVVVVALLLLALTPLSARLLLKPALVTALLASAAAAHFMDRYGIVIDEGMVRNVLETDAAEVAGLLTPALFLSVGLFGAIPAGVVAATRVRREGALRGALHRLALAGLVLAAALALVYANYRDLSLIAQQHRELRYLNNPLHPVYSLVRLAARGDARGAGAKRRVGDPVRDGAARGRRPTLVVLVVGETARAENFSLNGYARATNRYTAGRGVVSFSDVRSCSTSTATAIPCMFSFLGRAGFDPGAARRQENVLELLARAGVRVLWRENNSGCKGVCDGVPHERPGRTRPRACAGGHCFDEFLLDGLDERLRGGRTDALVVLHQEGSHGPAYHERYPPAFAAFTPECRDAQVDRCRTADLVNSYDNTLLYTDYVLARTLDMLERLAAQYDTAMLYLSDHGESLGEGGIYLHGLPYVIAPAAQTHIPLLLWLSDGYRASAGIDAACLAATRSRARSHDNLPHTLLGLLGVGGAAYDARLDLLAGCAARTAATVRAGGGPPPLCETCAPARKSRVVKISTEHP
ncbi:MAG: phosphoethanolamine--lipid A transferase [Gammaproteobacteria bacterium]|nr:phosphoethanolamine--lipid A transferase [Gammaproteobacteria bacterium]